MKRVDLLPREGQFYKSNLHCHTIHSDGALTAEEMKKEYMKHGYSVIAYTDHSVYINHKELNEDDFLAIAAYEVDINEFYKSGSGFSGLKTYHLNLYDTNPEWCKEDKEQSILPERRYNDINYINQFISTMKAKGFIACYNHPFWSLQTFEDFKGLRGLFGMEIYNHGCEIDGLYGYNPQSYDEMLREGNRLFCLSTDDNHNKFDFDHPLCDSFGGFTMIKAKDLKYDTVMKALAAGEFYSSMGPEINELYIEDGKLVVKCSPVEKIYVIQSGRACHYKLADRGETITQAEFELTGKEGYIRVDLKDEKGNHANSNAYFLDEIATIS